MFDEPGAVSLLPQLRLLSEPLRFAYSMTTFG